MVERHIAARGVRAENILHAMGTVPREAFLPAELRPHAYEDRPLPIGEGQTISQPFVVALMAEAAGLRPDDRVLEVGTGSGYAAAVFSRAAAEVFTVERHASLAEEARARFDEVGYDNVEVAVRDGTLGWPENAPYDAIIVAAGGPGRIPPPLLDQLAPGGRLVIPRGDTLEGQELVRIRRDRDGRLLDLESLGPVRFVPLVGEAGWTPEGGVAAYRERAPVAPERTGPKSSSPLAVRIAAAAEPFDDIDGADLAPLLDRIGDARVVCIGEASHGTSEFYRMRARITRELIERKGFATTQWQIPEQASEGGGPPRKYYELTALGRRALSAEVQRFFRGQGIDGVELYQGSQADRLYAEITTNTEAWRWPPRRTRIPPRVS